MSEIDDLIEEFQIGNMLPIMGSTKGFDTQLSNTDIEDVVDDVNDSVKQKEKMHDFVKVYEESKKVKRNDKGEEVPDKCPKCGSKIGVFLKGEPVYLCTNKKCNKYFGTLPFNESMNILDDSHLNKYLAERNDIMKCMDTVDDLLYEFFGESSNGGDKNIPDLIEPVVHQIESRGYKVKYASPGHSNTRFDNDRNDDGVINNKIVTTGRIIFQRDYKFKNTPQGWEWKVLKNGSKALYVKPYTYNEKMGSKEEAFKKWQTFYMDSIKDWAINLPQLGSDEESSPDENFNK